MATSFEAARLRACSEWRGLRRALYAITPIPTPHIPRAGIDEWWRVYYNPEWLAQLDVRQAAAVAAHEVWHPLRMHAKRARAAGVTSASHPVWNVAADIEIHQDDSIISVIRTIKDLIPAELALYPALANSTAIAEQWFLDLYKKAAEFPAGDEGSGVDGIRRGWENGPPSRDNPGISADRADIVRRQVAEDVKNVGTSSLGALLWAADVLDPKVDWRSALQFAFQVAVSATAGSSLWTYRRLSRRQPTDRRIVLPGYVGQSVAVAVLIDTSGSMVAELAQVRAEIRGLIASLVSDGCRPCVRAYTCDAAVTGVSDIWSSADVQMIGGGGTDMGVGLAAIAADHKKRPYDVVICVTDAYTPWPDSFDIPLITAVIGDYEVPGWLEELPHKVVRVNAVVAKG